MEAPDVACTRQLHRDGVHSHHNKDEDTEVHSGNVELHDNSSNTASNAEESFLLGNFGSFLIEDPQLRGLVLKFFSIIAVVQIFIFAFTSWHIIQSSLIDPAHLSTNPEFIYEQLKKAEKPVSHLVPARGFNTLDLVAIYVSSSASPSISYSVFSKQLSEFVESKRPILSHIWGDNFQVYTLCLNWTNRPALINELIPLIVEKTGRTHSTSDTLHYVFVDDAHFKPSTKVVDGFGIIDYHSQSSGISDFVPSFLVKSLFQVAIGRTLEHHRLSAAAHEQVSLPIPTALDPFQTVR